MCAEITATVLFSSPAELIYPWFHCLVSITLASCPRQAFTCYDGDVRCCCGSRCARDQAQNIEKSDAPRVVPRSMSHPDVISSAPSPAPHPTSIDPPSASHSGADSPAPVSSPVVSSPSLASQHSLQCSREQEDMLGSLVDTLSPTTMAKMLIHFFNSACYPGTAYFEPAPCHPTTASTTADIRLRSRRSPDDH